MIDIQYKDSSIRIYNLLVDRVSKSFAQSGFKTFIAGTNIAVQPIHLVTALTVD